MIKNELFEKIKQYKTPLYLYDSNVIFERIKTLKEVLPPNSKLFYSMKANPGLALCQLVRRTQCGIEVSSAGELYIARNAGFNVEDIIFTSPGKTYDELVYAIDLGIKLINVESVSEIMMINNIANDKQKQVNIGIRLNPAVSFSNAKIKMSGVSSQFGIEESNLDDNFFEAISKMSNIKLVGFQVYMGTQMLQANDIFLNFKYILGLVLKVTEKYNLELKYINFGGGFGIPYFVNEEELNMTKLKEKLQYLFKEYNSQLLGIETVFESGRYIMAEAGYFITKILYVKESKGIKYVICDGGSNFHSSAAFLGRFVRNNFPMYVVPESDEKTLCTVTGSLCTPLDVIGQKVEINKNVKPGDYLVVEKSGAYGLTYSPISFLSHQCPMELLIHNGEVKIIRERGQMGDFINNQRLIEDEDNDCV